MLIGIVRKLAELVFLVFLVASVSFLLIQLTPGSPAGAILGTSATPEAIAKVNAQLGLDRPVVVQYVAYITGLAHLDLGRSFINKESVATLVASRLPVTMSLAVLATLFATLIGIPIGVVASVRGGRIDRALTTVSGIGLALPSFWLAALLVLIFGLYLKVLPATGYVPVTTSPRDWATHMVLPVTALTVVGIASVTRQTRNAMILESGRDYTRALLAAGVPRRSIIWRHLLRNASIPVVTTLGLLFVAVLGGAVVIEYFFALPGIGSLVVSAAATHDLPVVQGVVVASAIVVLLVNLMIDLAVWLLNPKVRRA